MKIQEAKTKNKKCKYRFNFLLTSGFYKCIFFSPLRVQMFLNIYVLVCFETCVLIVFVRMMVQPK
jgi:predicted neutral ceramidase superfamily lipid hydrolase